MNKEKCQYKTDVISFDEFIDIITGGKGEQIKKDLKRIEKKTGKKIVSSENYLDLKKKKLLE